MKLDSKHYLERRGLAFFYQIGSRSVTPNFNVILSEANVANGVEGSLVGPQGNRNHSAGSAASLEIHQLQPPSLRLTWKGHGFVLRSDAKSSILVEQRLNVQSRLGEGLGVNG